ncbi:hypothetical protein DAPPUDRAFT_63850, partial [Daphnia pulex]
TIFRRLQKEGLHCRIAAKKEFLTNAQKEQRMAFATAYADKDEQGWRSVIFSDEKTFGSHENGRPFVIRTNGTRFVPGHTFSIKRSGRKSIPVWGWFSFDEAGAIHHINGRLTAEKYIRVLEDHLV